MQNKVIAIDIFTYSSFDFKPTPINFKQMVEIYFGPYLSST